MVFKGKTGGKTRKGKGSKGSNNTKPIEVGRITWNKARKEIKFIKLKTTAKAKNIRKNDILSKLLAEVKKKNPSRIALGNTLDNAVKSWAKSSTVKYKYLLKVEKNQYLSAQEFWVRKKASKSAGDKWQAFQGVKVSATAKANDKIVAEAFFKDFGSEKHLLAFDFKKNKPSSEVAGKVMDALFEHISEKDKQRVSSIYLLKKEEKKVYDVVAAAIKAVKDIGTNKFQSAIGKWAINRKDSRGQKIFLYATITSDAQAQGKGGGIKVTREACFVGSTKVWLADYSPITINRIKRGMKVRAQEVTTGQEVVGTVTHLTQRQVHGLVKVYTPADTFLVTYEHPYRANGQWIEAGELKKGDVLTLLDHKTLLASKKRLLPRSHLQVDSIAYVDTLVTVYNFTVAQYHNYYVGNVGTLVHNTEVCREPLELLSNGDQQSKDVLSNSIKTLRFIANQITNNLKSSQGISIEKSKIIFDKQEQELNGAFATKKDKTSYSKQLFSKLFDDFFETYREDTPSSVKGDKNHFIYPLKAIYRDYLVHESKILTINEKFITILFPIFPKSILQKSLVRSSGFKLDKDDFIPLIFLSQQGKIYPSEKDYGTYSRFIKDEILRIGYRKEKFDLSNEDTRFEIEGLVSRVKAHLNKVFVTYPFV